MQTSPHSAARSPARRPPILLDVIEEHLEEFGYLSIQRRKMTFSPEVGLDGIVRLDARLEAHRDGVVEAGPAGIEVAAARVDDRDPWQRYAGVRIWIESSPPPDRVLGRLHDAPADALASWREALRRVPPETLARAVPAGDAASAGERVRPILVEARGCAGMIAPETLSALADDGDPSMRVAVARALGRGSGGATAGAADLAERLVSDPAPEVRRAALWGLAVLARERAIERCRKSLEGEGDPFAVQTLGLLGGPPDVARILPLIAPPATRGAAIRALGHLGDPAIVELLLRLMESDDVDAALAAQDAFETLVGPVPPAPRTRPPLRTDELTPRPRDAAHARRFWSRRRESLEEGRRWLRGLPFPDASSLDGAPMERRWRHLIGGFGGGSAWLRHEVPDGFFDAAPTAEALPGE